MSRSTSQKNREGRGPNPWAGATVNKDALRRMVPYNKRDGRCRTGNTREVLNQPSVGTTTMIGQEDGSWKNADQILLRTKRGLDLWLKKFWGLEPPITAQERARLTRIYELGQPYVAIFTSTLFTTEIPQNGSFLRILNEHYENIKFQLLMRYQPSATHNSLECVAAHLYGNLSHIQQALTRLGTIDVLTKTGITCSVADLQAVLGQMLENWPREYRPK